MLNLEPCFAHVEMGSSAQQAVTVPIASEPPQVEGTGELGGPPCKVYMDTSTFSSLFFPHQHCYYPFCPLYPSCSVIYYFLQVAGWPSRNSRTGGRVGRSLLYQQLLQLI
jgi:hypothetical protein